MEKRVLRKLPVGAELLPDGVHFRVWAPKCRQVEVVIEHHRSGRSVKDIALPLAAEKEGYFSGTCDAGPGALYRFRLDGGERFPDPASRFQPEGPHGPSCVVDPSFPWSDQAWPGLTLQGQVLYEMHIGTYTPSGTWEGATQQLSNLRDLGITAVEIMPVAEFPGRFGWSYDGVNLFAPTRLYGQPDDFRRFVDTAHSLGMGVILDVVYNHLGPEGNYLRQFSADYFTTRYQTEWGDPVNFDGETAGPVREFFIANARYWIEEFHVDGLRLDATQTLFDSSPRHIIACIVEKAREAAGKRSILIIGENEPQDVKLLMSPEKGGYGLDALWNDDFHHTSQVALTGYNDAYYSEYTGSPQELISAVKWGYLYQGQHYFWQGKRRGTPTFGIDRSCFVTFIQNHDQVANSAWGTRIHQRTSPGSYRAMTALLLLSPGTPMLFQGQEFAASSPFLYFADLHKDIARLVRKGRVEFLKQFTNIASPEVVDSLDSPSSVATFERSRLHLTERERHHSIYNLHRDLIRLRKEDTVFRAVADSRVEGAVMGPEGFLLRFFLGAEQRLLLVNMGRDIRLRPAPEPLLAPPQGSLWEILWSSESPHYGGAGTPELETDHYWRIPGHAVVVLHPAPIGDIHE